MALIGTIRKNFWFVLILLGLALAAFILMDMTAAGNAGGTGSLTMGSIAGEKIDYRAFQTTESAYFGNAPGDAFSKKKNIWDFYVQDALLKRESNKLGLAVSSEELMDLQFGANPSQIIQANWRNPQTGQLDIAQLNQFKSVIENGEEMNKEFRIFWAEQEKQIIKDRVQSKLNNLVGKSVYTPSWMAEESYKLDNDVVDFNYIKIPFDQIDGSGVEVKDSDISSFIAAQKHQYEVNEPTRVIEFASFEVLPSEEDKSAILNELDSLKNQFASTQDDSTFTTRNNGAYTHLYATADQLPVDARDQITSLEPGQLYGPFEQEGIYLVVKMLDKRKIADTVEASHILKRTSTPQSVTDAYAFVDSLKRVLRSGISFDTLALRHSDDESNKAVGGSIGRFTQQSIPQAFNRACFLEGREGGYYTVQTEFGVHLVRIDDVVYNDNELKYQIASVAKSITPSLETQNQMYDRVTEIVSGNKEISQLRAAMDAEPGVVLEKSTALRANDYAIGNLPATQASREIIQWAFDPSTELGDVSADIYKFIDQVNYYDKNYVLVSLNSIIPAGLPTADAMRSTLETRVMNKLKGEKFAGSFKFNSLQEAASTQGVEVLNAANIGSKSSIITGIGNEPKVLAAAFGTAVQAVSQPIVGESGIYIVQPISRQEPGDPTNLAMVKSGLNQSTKSQVDFSLIKNMTKRADIKDSRSDFF